MNNPTEPMRILYMPLPLTSRSGARDRDNVLALWHARKWFTHVAIVTRSWQETPDAIFHPDVRIAVALCEHFGLKVIWGRWLWVGWPSDKLEAPMPNDKAHFYEAYYAATIANLKAEARALGARWTMLDVEPNGEPLNEAALMAGLTSHHFGMVQVAIDRATRFTGKVDFITPCSSMSSTSYPWSLIGIGENRMDQKTYRLKRAHLKVNANPPAGFEHKVHVWGHWVGENALSVADVKAFDMERVRDRFPENIGQWVYIPASQFAVVVKGWNG